jgi:hypothetical protein
MSNLMGKVTEMCLDDVIVDKGEGSGGQKDDIPFRRKI